METTSAKNEFNKQDFYNWLKNLLIFVLPIALANIGAIENWILLNLSINPEVLAIILSSGVKFAEYFIRNNTEVNPLETNTPENV